MDIDKTESLARKLNIVERLVIPSSTVVNWSSKSNSDVTPRHLIALKFQSTSGKLVNSSSDGVEELKVKKGEDDEEVEEKEEIIDFAAVAVSLETESIVAAFHQYVMPTEIPILSSACREATRVSQEVVDNGVPLKTCLMLYGKWLTKLEKDVGLEFRSKHQQQRRQHRRDEDTVTVIATWSDWDLGKCLPKEARRKRLVYAKHLSSGWVDLRAVFTEHFKRVPMSLRDAVTRSELIWKKRESRALEYAVNISSLALAMHEKRLPFKRHIKYDN